MLKHYCAATGDAYILIDDWNTRPVEDELRAENERLKTVVGNYEQEDYERHILDEDKPE